MLGPWSLMRSGYASRPRRGISVAMCSDGPVLGPRRRAEMAKRRRPWWGAGPYENFRQNVVRRFMNFDRDAKNHVIGRNQSVAQVLGYLNLLYNSGLLPEGSQVVPGGARWQSLGGSRPEGSEGAHCLPCQLLVIPPGASEGI